MTIQDYFCTKCQTPYIPYAKDVVCPKCKTPGKEQDGFVEKLFDIFKSHKKIYNVYMPPVWNYNCFTDSLIAAISKILDDMPKEKEKFEAYITNRLMVQDWKEYNYLKNYIMKLAILIREKLD